MGKSPYCLDEIRIEQGVDDTPDWFELRITVVIGDIRLPFSRFESISSKKRESFFYPTDIILLEEWFSKYANARWRWGYRPKRESA